MAPVVEMVVHPFAARVVGQASRRGLIPRVPTAERLLTDVEAWLTGGVPRSRALEPRSSPADGEARLEASLHPAARNLVLTATRRRPRRGRGRDRRHSVPATTGSSAGVLERMEIDQAISWGRVDPDRPDESDDAATATFADRTATERAYLGWLGRTLVEARAARMAGERPRSRSGRPTACGSRSTARSRRRSGRATTRGSSGPIADTRVAIDVTPWWADAIDAQSLLNRALCLMWLDVRWRPPALKPEGLVLDEVHRLLSRAYPLDPSLGYPWHAWAEIVGLRNIADPMGRQVVARAMREAGADPTIGYRRAPVTISHEGWALTIPGSFAEKRTAEEWWGGGAGRAITLAAVQTGTASGAMPAHAFIDQFAGDDGPRCDRPPGRRRGGPCDAVERRQLRRRDRDPRGLLGGASAPAPRSASSSTIRPTGSGPSTLEVARPGLRAPRSAVTPRLLGLARRRGLSRAACRATR